VKVLILGSGGREHALAWRLSRDPDPPEVLIAPGNPGTAQIGRNLPVDLASPEAVLALARKERASLTVVGPEAPLEAGVADLFRRQGHSIVGPTKHGAALECSKAHAKEFMHRYAIPTAEFVTCTEVDSALEAVSGSRFGFPVVVKADGLAAGKGVTVAADRTEAEGAVRTAMVDRAFGSAGSRLIIERCLSGPEVSMFYLLDGYRGLYLGSAQDHKRIRDGDQGPNTGGMGAFAPSPLATPELERDVARRIVRPVIEGHQAIGEPYVGFLYVSLMLTNDGPKVIEFNVRFGDPEAQVVLPLQGGSLTDLLRSAAAGGLTSDAVITGSAKSVGVVLASRGYPASAESGHAIRGLEAAGAIDDVTVFHAGTKTAGDGVVTAGGRVLTVVAIRPSFGEAIDLAYRAVDNIHFDGMQFRRDIGRKALERV
jgi:phosphoribosylamine---glycine ligase